MITSSNLFVAGFKLIELLIQEPNQIDLQWARRPPTTKKFAVKASPSRRSIVGRLRPRKKSWGAPSTIRLLLVLSRATGSRRLPGNGRRSPWRWSRSMTSSNFTGCSIGSSPARAFQDLFHIVGETLGLENPAGQRIIKPRWR